MIIYIINTYDLFFNNKIIRNKAYNIILLFLIINRCMIYTINISELKYISTLMFNINFKLLTIVIIIIIITHKHYLCNWVQ